MSSQTASRKRNALKFVALGAVSMAVSGFVSAQNYPSKPITLQVPFAPGGTTDILARAMAVELTKAFGQPFVVDNRAGAGGNIGSDIVA